MDAKCLLGVRAADLARFAVKTICTAQVNWQLHATNMADLQEASVLYGEALLHHHRGSPHSSPDDPCYLRWSTGHRYSIAGLAFSHEPSHSSPQQPYMLDAAILSAMWQVFLWAQMHDWSHKDGFAYWCVPFVLGGHQRSIL